MKPLQLPLGAGPLRLAAPVTKTNCSTRLQKTSVSMVLERGPLADFSKVEHVVVGKLLSHVVKSNNPLRLV